MGCPKPRSTPKDKAATSSARRTRPPSAEPSSVPTLRLALPGSWVTRRAPARAELSVQVQGGSAGRAVWGERSRSGLRDAEVRLLPVRGSDGGGAVRGQRRYTRVRPPGGEGGRYRCSIAATRPEYAPATILAKPMRRAPVALNDAWRGNAGRRMPACRHRTDCLLLMPRGLSGGHDGRMGPDDQNADGRLPTAVR